jgi:hypothetical protein
VIRNIEDGKEGQTNFILMPETVTKIHLLKICPNRKFLLVITSNQPDNDFFMSSYDMRNSNAPKCLYTINLTKLIEEEPATEI